MSEESYHIAAYTALIIVFLFCGLLRLCNPWQLSGKNLDELYPARRIALAAYLSVLLLFPCLLHPQSPDTLLFARSFWIIYIPAVSSLAFRQFFFSGDKRKKLRLAAVGGVSALAILSLFAFACAGGDALMPYSGSVRYAAGVLGVLLAAYLLHVIVWICHEVFLRWRNEYSNEDDFPRYFAVSVCWMSAVTLLAAWGVFFADNPLWDAVFVTGITLAGMGILVTILHPQRQKKCAGEEYAIMPDATRSVEEKPEEDEQAKKTGGMQAVATMPEQAADEMTETPESGKEKTDVPQERTKKLSPSQLDNFERQIRRRVEGKKLFLDPNLKRDVLEKELNINHSYLSEVFTLRFGSFYKYVNSLRVEYALRYAAEHPQAKQTEIALHSGFGSVRTYCRVKTLYEADKLE